ncbi:sugar transferase [Sulfurimonas aquatica]|uniref:Sugar transferase n=1 Tax=Sulfurimonas aquatica TaxID=2672570 RepID=A0A975AZ91_9BACT|nr:hypothetical protein [Sulfurimonas aquatica]QSZ41230.1 sugar transferase [Sulfurimonas aquatica]
MELAPIALSVYNRLDHLKKTVSALKDNTLASESELYIFSDGPMTGDEESINKVRQYIKTIDGFKSIHITEREYNSRQYNNRQGMRQLLDNYGKLIYIEDDIVTSKFFLQFMNDALDKYENVKNVTSICGYTSPIEIPQDYPYDVIVDPIACIWGFGIWKDRFDEINWKITDFEDFCKNPSNLIELDNLGKCFKELMEAEHLGVLDAMDIKLMYQQFKNKHYTITPKYSLVNNIGWDGSGDTCAPTTRFNVDLSKVKHNLNVSVNAKVDNKVLDNLKKFRDTPSEKKWEIDSY